MVDRIFSELKRTPNLTPRWLTLGKYSLALSIVILSIFVTYSSASVCTSSSRATRSCGNWLWRRRCSYYITTYHCCYGWTGSIDTNCSTPLCDGNFNTSACTIAEGRTELPTGEVFNSSGGQCTAPDVCENCNPGYYADGPYCRACTPISRCLYPNCTSDGDSVCLYCEGEVNNAYGMHAYTRFTDDGKSCKRACSWRPGSRCYPGSCPATTLASCSCTAGFSGPDCNDITEDPAILQNFARLTHHTGTTNEITEAPSDSSNSEEQPKVWTNYQLFTHAEAHVDAAYKKDLPEPPDYIHVAGSKVGIVQGNVTFRLQRGDTIEADTVLTARCAPNDPQPSNFRCEGEFALENEWISYLPFQHDDIVMVSFSVSNGGHISVYNREKGSTVESVSLQGRTKSSEFTIAFDVHPPEHCLTSCATPSLEIPDITTNEVFSISWGGWSDSLSGLESLHIEVFLLTSTGISTTSLLRHGEKVNKATQETIPLDASEAQVTLYQAGPYSITLTAFDKAGNHQTTRRVMVFDDKSKVVLQGSNDIMAASNGGCSWGSVPSAPIVTNANPQTDCTWITSYTNTVNILWKDHFINRRHIPWLAEVENLDYVAPEYDDNEGERRLTAIDNILGIVRFEVGYTVVYENNEDEHPFYEILELHSESTSIPEPMVDGKRLFVRIRGYDIYDEYAEDNITVTADASPPVIEQLSLTRGGRVNLTVHNALELSKMTIEWKTHDYHSGLLSVYWRIYDNYNGGNITHGSGHLSPQGDVQTKEECESAYGGSTRGHDCYCSPYDGCFHAHFEVRPQVIIDGFGGVHPDKELGVHDSDYHIDIVSTNRAMQSTTRTLKVSIDTSPPIEGVVFDGFQGYDEVDFQQDKILHAYWDGFVDKESGVVFYRYGFATDCLPPEQFDIETSTESGLEETTATSASHAVDTEGTYYITVAAYNRALDHSVPVCSDGVTVDTSSPAVSEVTVEGAKTKTGVFKDGSNQVWLLQPDRTIQRVVDPRDECGTSLETLPEEEFSFYPRRLNKEGTTDIRHIYCSELRNVATGEKAFLASADNLAVSWKVKSGKSGVYDYEVGIASLKSQIPDVYPFISTSHLQRVNIRHPNIATGVEFYILIKSISKAGKSRVQVIGPFITDTTKPVFSGNIEVTYAPAATNDENSFLIINWPAGAFHDPEDDQPLQTTMAIGSTATTMDILKLSPLSFGSTCPSVQVSRSCVAIDTSKLPWTLHGNQEYYITLVAENSAGLTKEVRSAPYIHAVVEPKAGVVYDVSSSSHQVHDIQDIDFQIHTDHISGKWIGFTHPYLEVTYTVCLGENDLIVSETCKDVGGNEEGSIENLDLSYYRKYSVVVIATAEGGETTAMSDGVYVIQPDDELSDVKVYDGVPCDKLQNSEISGRMTHHSESPAYSCLDDYDYQLSTTIVHASWTIPQDKSTFIHDVMWKVEERAETVGHWTALTDWEHVSSRSRSVSSSSSLQPGRRYRVKFKFCVGDICYKEMFTDGVTVTPSPPEPGTLHITYGEVMEELIVVMDKFYDTDIRDPDEAMAAISYYEWTFTDDSGHPVDKWKKLNDVTTGEKSVSFTVHSEAPISASKCWKLAVRGYNYAGLSALVSKEIRNCSELVRPATVIDAVGYAPDTGTVHRPEPILLGKHDPWMAHDEDYTPFNTMLSAVWPTLRYRRYEWAVLEYIGLDVSNFYAKDDGACQMLSKPCDTPNAIACNTTDSEFVNVEFSGDELVHGRRYLFYVHASATLLKHEYWEEALPELHACSDGITIDLVPPQPGPVWINNKAVYQTSASDVAVYWESFLDIEGSGTSVYSSGISHYEVTLGTVRGGSDVAFKNVGVTNHHCFHGLELQNGQTYYAAVAGTDFARRRALSDSAIFIIDFTPPELLDGQIVIDNRHIVSSFRSKACWAGVFKDTESGISHYEWAVGSMPNYDDISAYGTAFEECVYMDPTSDNSFKDGHAYYISVKGYNGAGLWSSVSSWAFTVDSTPPVTGQVLDGEPQDNGSDVDYQKDRGTLWVHWTGFTDPHTTIKDYSVHIGTCSGCDNLLQRQYVGLIEEIRLDQLSLVEGLCYFTTVTACNTADLCSSATSDGVTIDSTPPIPGRVLDGLWDTDSQYQASRDNLGAEWIGFSDPQSSISHFQLEAGTLQDLDNVIPKTRLHTEELVVFSNLEEEFGNKLPVNVPIYITITAFNALGESEKSTSNGFIVDVTGPVFIEPLTHVSIGSLVPSTSVFRNTLRVAWDVLDEQSYIECQYLSISSHVGEDVNVSINIAGPVRQYTFTSLDFHDGSRYDVHLSSCNGAKLCTKSDLMGLLVDNSPPIAGTFAVDTEHGANIYREPDESMTWTEHAINLAWLGFSDPHSGVDSYKISVGSLYMGSDLNEIEEKNSPKKKHDPFLEGDDEEEESDLNELCERSLI